MQELIFLSFFILLSYYDFFAIVFCNFFMHCLLQSFERTNNEDRIQVMALSANYRRIALYSEKGVLWIGSSDLATKDLEYSTGSTIQPKQMAW